jgi:hypothetical protein
MFTPALMIVSPSEIMPIIAIGTIIIERKAGTGGKERLFIVAGAAAFLLLAFVMAFIAFAADIPVNPPDFT